MQGAALATPVGGPGTFADAIEQSDRDLARARALAASFPNDWTRHEAFGLAALDRFRLTGNYRDLHDASRAIERRRALVPPPAGPLLAEAQVAMAAHQMAPSQRAIDSFAHSVAPTPQERAQIEATAGDLAFYRGDIREAQRRYAAAAALDAAGVPLRDVIVAKARGDFDGAVRAIHAWLGARRRPSHFAVATAALQIGAIELARGNHAAARLQFEQADRAFPGYWLTHAHLAQADALDDRPRRAITRMRAVAESSDSAEAMDALALLLRAYGSPAESRLWARRAGAKWAERLALAEEAALGHAVEHELVFGSPARALILARRNVANRPFGESRILLANALLQTGRYSEAIEQLRVAEASGWRSAPLFALRAEILTLSGDQRAATRARVVATELNPSIFEARTALIWFSHG